MTTCCQKRKFSVVPPKADQRRRWSLRRLATGLIVQRNTYNTAVTPYYKNAAFTWWERLPAANIVIALCRHRLSRLEVAPTRVIKICFDQFYKIRRYSSFGFKKSGSPGQCYDWEDGVICLRGTTKYTGRLIGISKPPRSYLPRRRL